jgi:hypothetical protein
VLRHYGHDLIAYKGYSIITIEVRSGWKNGLGEIKWMKKSNAHKSSHFAVVITGCPVHYEPEIPDEPIQPAKPVSGE